MHFSVAIEICGYSQLDLCVSFYSYFYAHVVIFWKLQFTRFLQLDLCVALKNSIHSTLNAYAVLTVFCRPHNLRILQHKKKNYSDNHSGRAYKQGTLTVKGLTNKVLEYSPG